MSDLVLGAEFAGCRIEQVIARGGMGVVYRGRDLSLDRLVAIKLVTDERAADAGARERFKREARLMAAIDHPNVIPVYAAGEQDGHLYLVMRYVDGTDLQRRLREHERLAPLEAARIVDQVGRALDAAHERGIVHRDIKPANVLLSGDHVYLSDFGITRLVDEHTRATDSAEWVGTVDYVSPEHLRGEPTDALSDVYSLGCLLYACLAGTPPYRRRSTAATITAKLHERPPRVSQIPGVPRQFDAVIGRALAARPKDRYQSAGRLGAAALAAAQPGTGVPLLRRRRRTAAPSGSVPAADPAEHRTRVAPPTRVTRGGATEVAPVTAATSVAGQQQTRFDDRPRTAPETPSSPPGPRRRAVVVAALALVLAAAAVLAALSSFGGGAANAPLSTAEIAATVQRFATGYGDRDARVLSRVLAPEVTRVGTTSTQHGRAAVLRLYEQQFRTRPVPVGYLLRGVAITPGLVGRASGRYTVTLRGGRTFGGEVVFGVERLAGRPVIALIATH